MPAPTRAEIQADIIQPTFLVETWNGSAWVTLAQTGSANQPVLTVDGQLETSSGPNGLAFGADTLPALTLTLWGHTLGAPSTTDLLPVRISYGRSASDKAVVFTGIVMERADSDSSTTLTIRGHDAFIEAPPADIRSPLFFRRLIATATSVTSVEDPTSGSYAAGLINYILWQCGGRPYEQGGSYPLSSTVRFYYSCENAQIAPDWTWTNAENPMEELRRLARATGGQIYQDAAGTVRYVNPLSLANGSSTHTFTDEALTAAQRVSQNKSHYVRIGRKRVVRDAVSRVTCAYTRLRIEAAQEIYRDTTPRYLDVGGVLALDLDFTWPISTQLQSIQVSATAVRHNGGATLTTSELTVTIGTVTAQRANVTLTNTLSVPVTVSTVRAVGQPVGPEETSGAIYSSGSVNGVGRTLPYEDNAYVQDDLQAAVLCRMTHDFYSVPGEIVTLTGCLFDMDRFVGETVSVTSSKLGLSAVAHRIVAIRHSSAGAWMDVDAAPIAGLPKLSDFFAFDTAYSAGATRQVGY